MGLPAETQKPSKVITIMSIKHYLFMFLQASPLFTALTGGPPWWCMQALFKPKKKKKKPAGLAPQENTKHWAWNLQRSVIAELRHITQGEKEG